MVVLDPGDSVLNGSEEVHEGFPKQSCVVQHHFLPLEIVHFHVGLQEGIVVAAPQSLMVCEVPPHPVGSGTGSPPPWALLLVLVLVLDLILVLS